MCSFSFRVLFLIMCHSIGMGFISYSIIRGGSSNVSISDSNATRVSFVLQVEEVKKHNHCLAFSSAGPQSQTYYVSFDSFTEHLRWHRHAAKVLFVCMCIRVRKRKGELKHMLPVSTVLTGQPYCLSEIINIKIWQYTCHSLPAQCELSEFKGVHNSLLSKL